MSALHKRVVRQVESRTLLKCTIILLLPRYDFLLSSPLLGGMQLEAEFDWGGTHIWVSSCVVEDLRVYFIEPANGFFKTPTVYGRYDDEVRTWCHCMVLWCAVVCCGECIAEHHYITQDYVLTHLLLLSVPNCQPSGCCAANECCRSSVCV